MKRQTVEYIYKNCKLDPDTGCLVWQKSTDRDGYPKSTMIEKDGTTNYRVVRSLFHRLGIDILGKFIHYKCGNRLCLNKDHLQIVHSQKELRKLVQEEGRQAKGQDLDNTFLTDEEYLQMYADYKSGTTTTELADEYGYSSPSACWNALNRHWGHLRKKVDKED